MKIKLIKEHKIIVEQTFIKKYKTPKKNIHYKKIQNM